MRLLFISNLFPDARERYRGLDNATILHALHGDADIRAVALRPMLPWKRATWSAREEDAPFAPQYVRVPYIPKFGHRWNHRLYARALRPVVAKIAAEWSFDAVLCAWLYPDACAVSRLPEVKGKRFVAIAQGSDVHHYLGISARREIIVSHLASAAGIITRSADLARRLGEAGLAADRLHPVYNGVDLATFHPPSPAEKAAARESLGIPPGAPLILFVGNFLPVKNPLLLLEAHASLVTRHGDAHLAIIGAGPIEPEMRQLAGLSGIAEHVHFLGRREAPGVAEAMRAADVLVLPSKNEGVPNVILEAFATGLPVVASRVGGIPEVHGGDAFGRLVPAGNRDALATALAAVLENPPDRGPIAAHGKTFSWERTSRAYRALLHG